jgi:hypothetical protein
MTGTVPANLPAAPIFKHPEQEDEAEGGVLVTIREDAPLDFRARACSNRLGVRGGRRTGGRRAGSAHRNHTGGYEQYTHDGEDHSDTREPHLLSLQVESGPALSAMLPSANQAIQEIVRAIPAWSRPRAVYVFGALSVSLKLEAPDVKLSELLVAASRDDAVHDQLRLRDGLVARIAYLAVRWTAPESGHAG